MTTGPLRIYLANRCWFSMAIPEGMKLGRYEIRSLLGAGGMGEVYLAHDLTLHRPVAIKVLRTDLTSDEERLLRFEREAYAASSLNHPNILTIYEIGHEDKYHFIVTEFIDGESLGQRLTKGEFRPDEILEIGVQITSALSAAHAAGIIHRDIKPDNIMVRTDGLVKVLDFGLAKLVSDEASLPEDSEAMTKGLDVTMPGSVMGTVRYMSPEQARGVAVDLRTDIWSLGVVLYQMVTGHLPFTGTTMSDVMVAILTSEPALLSKFSPNVAPELERIVSKALRRDQKERFNSVLAMALELKSLKQRVEFDAQMQSAGKAEGTSAERLRRVREAERRQVTVLACGCDLFESQAYLEGLDAEGQARLLQMFRQACEQVVRRFDGTVIQCNEQGLVVCFGYPVAHEDGAQRATRTALAIFDNLKELDERLRREQDLALDSWIGIHTGQAVVEVGEDAVSLVGEARNVAVRLQEVALPSQIICSATTYGLIGSHFNCTSLGKKKIRGVSQLIELFEVQGVGENLSPIEALSPAGLTPLTGRDHEISLLKDRWEQAEDGIGQVVLLIGEPGLGKSRVVYTMKQHVADQAIGAEAVLDAATSSESRDAAQNLQVVEWRCSPQFQNTSLYPTKDFFERALGFRREDGLASRFDRLVDHLQAYDLTGNNLVQLFASLLSLPLDERFQPLGLSPTREREETFRVLEEYLRTRSRACPILFVLEDLHWADASTIEFLEQFLCDVQTERILMLLTFRPEFQVPWRAPSHQTSLALNRLTRRQVNDLIQHKTKGSISASLVEQIYDRTSGVPLFVEEFTTMMQESAVLRQDSKDSGEVIALSREIPATLQDLMIARLDRMEGGREVAELAATLGREFSYELIAAVATVSEPLLQAGLDQLVRLEILYSKGRPAARTYSFKHALLEDALYNSLVTGKRRQFHQRIAEVLEAQFPQVVDTQPELLAHHFSEAGLAQNAVAYWLRAGLRSRKRSADSEAIGHLTKGLKLLETLDETGERDQQRLQFLSALGPAYIAVRGYAAPEVGPVLERARDLCERIGQPSELFATMLGIWEWRLVRGDIRLCLELAADGMALAERLDDPGMLMEALFMPGATMFYRAEFAEARTYHETALAKYDDHDRTKSWSASTGHNASVTHRCYLALTLWHLGYPDQALTLLRETRILAAQIGHAFSTAHAIDFSACLYHYCGFGAELQAMAHDEIAIAIDQGFQFWQVLGEVHKAAGMLVMGSRDEGLPLFSKALSEFRATGAELRVPYYLGMLGEAYRQAGRFDDAIKTLKEGLNIAEKNGDSFHEAELHRLMGESVLADSNDFDTAENCFRQAISIAQSQQSRALELRATISLARLWHRQARVEEARDALTAIYSSYTEGFSTADLMEASAVLESLGVKSTGIRDPVGEELVASPLLQSTPPVVRAKGSTVALKRTPIEVSPTDFEVTLVHPASSRGDVVTGIKRPKRAIVLALATLVVAIAVASLASLRYGKVHKAGITSLAVLPFTNTSNDPEKEYLSNGISESLINRLSQLPGIKVIANSSSSRYKAKDADPEEVATALGVAAVLTGRVLQRGDDLFINVELIDASDRTQLWGQQYNRKATDLLAVQADISREIAEALRLRLTAGQQQKLITSGMVKPEAYELLLKGRFHSARGSLEDRKKAGEYFNQAIVADPDYALAYAELSDIYRSLVNSGTLDPKEYLPKAESAAQKSLELDDGLAEGHYSLANLKTYDWQWAEAEREYKRAIELNPNLALAHRWYASYLRLVGRSEQAVAEIKRARELDPLSPGVNATVGYLFFGARQYDQAIEVLKKTMELDQTYPYAPLFLGFTYATKGMFPEAIASYQEAIKLGLDTPSTQIHLGVAYARAGNREQAQAILKRLQMSTAHVSPSELAMLYTAMGEQEKAFASLEAAYEAHDLQLQYLGVAPEFDPLRADPRFQDLLRRVGLTP